MFKTFLFCIEFLRGIEGFATDTVKAGIGFFIDIAVCGAKLPEFLAGWIVVDAVAAFLPDIELDVEGAGEMMESFSIVVDEFLNGSVLCLCGLNVFEGIFVATGGGNGVFSQEALIPGDSVSLDEFKGVADMRGGIDIRNGGGDVKFITTHVSSLQYIGKGLRDGASLLYWREDIAGADLKPKSLRIFSDHLVAHWSASILLTIRWMFLFLLMSS